MSGDPEQEYFADGMVEDIITALSRISSLFVIARNSRVSPTEARPVEHPSIGPRIDVRYFLEGSVFASRAIAPRITGQLVEAETRELISGPTGSTARPGGRVRPAGPRDHGGRRDYRCVVNNRRQKFERASRKPTKSMLAYDWLLQALGEDQLWDRESNSRTIEFGRRAISLDPHFALAYAYLAKWIQRRKLYGWMSDEAAETTEGIEFAHRAVRLEPRDPTVLTEAGLLRWGTLAIRILQRPYPCWTVPSRSIPTRLRPMAGARLSATWPAITHWQLSMLTEQSG